MDSVDDPEGAGGVSFGRVVRLERVDLARQRFRFSELRWQATR